MPSLFSTRTYRLPRAGLLSGLVALLVEIGALANDITLADVAVAEVLGLALLSLSGLWRCGRKQERCEHRCVDVAKHGNTCDNIDRSKNGNDGQTPISCLAKHPPGGT